MTQCPCCGRPLVSCIRNHHQYYFCPHCWAEMPNLQHLTLMLRQSPQADTDTEALFDADLAPVETAIAEGDVIFPGV